MAFSVKLQRKTSGAIKKALGLNPFGFKRVLVGFPRGKVDSDIVDRAVWNEFGTRGSGKGFKTARGGGFGGPIPERPFLRTAMRQNKAKYRAAMKASAALILNGETSVDIVLTKLGIVAQADIVRSINGWTTPGNSETTKRLKGSSHPLIDTGEMRAAVTYQIIGLGSVFRGINDVSREPGS